jgi:hypothetical protein
MHYAISYELATVRIDRLRRTGRKSRLAEQLWALLHAQAVLDGSATYPHQR